MNTRRREIGGDKKSFSHIIQSHSASFLLWSSTEILNLDEMLYQIIEEPSFGKNGHIRLSSGCFRVEQPRICNSLIYFCSLDQLYLYLADEEAGREQDTV